MVGNQVKKYKCIMKAQGGYGNFPPIEIIIVEGRMIIIDGHHRARAAGAAGIRNVPVLIIDVSAERGRQLMLDAADAAENLGLPW
ncbi:ParB-like nuclease domain protein [Thalassoglobus neptunius]|uniref:ParB-like nuclease domain protein n=1 Tax=Thalassoglobus neptunius TaxID=1938619 RepID=A0A5C5UUC9_9PLAN|nr:ParB N-terminal domain-containing protein [Thalassoglobus neptunius]TWT29132.1 ParB-like nuclease domain protein [Thalassoglobus neptunius]